MQQQCILQKPKKFLQKQCQIDPSIKLPFVMQVCGPSQSGKSTFVAKLIINASNVMEHPIDEVFWFCPHANLPANLLKSNPKTTPIINVYNELPYSWEQNRTKTKRQTTNDDDDDDDDEEETRPAFSLPTHVDGKHRLIVIDDFADEAKNSNAITALYTRGAHHLNVSVVQLLQNMFWRGPQSRTRSLNIQYLALMRQTRDFVQIKTLAGQLTRSVAAKNAFLSAYDDAINSGKSNYGYLFLSFHPRDDPEVLCRTHIFPDEGERGTIYQLPGQRKAIRKQYLKDDESDDEEMSE